LSEGVLGVERERAAAVVELGVGLALGEHLVENRDDRVALLHGPLRVAERVDVPVVDELVLGLLERRLLGEGGEDDRDQSEDQGGAHAFHSTIGPWRAS